MDDDRQTWLVRQTPRFMWYAFSESDSTFYVIDTRSPDTETTQVVLFGRFTDKASAVMTCMALNSWTETQEATH